MSVNTIPIEPFLQLAKDSLILDVRSPAEYLHAHIKDAVSLPLFDDEERKVVGTIYKQKSREDAIKTGLDYFGPKMKSMVVQVDNLLLLRHSKTVLVHCWRGGMRSAAVAWLLDLYGFRVYTLKGGYKTFRNWVLAQFEKKQPLRILGGCTGCGKTEILHQLAKLDRPMLDLEGLASHKGSAFGDLGLPPQPSAEQFENNLAMQLFDFETKYPNKKIWVEGESSRIGNIGIHHLFFNQMKLAERVEISVPFAERLNKIVHDYGSFEKAPLKAAVERIRRRLGGTEANNTIKHLQAGEIKEAFEILIQYYDKGYRKGSLLQPPILTVDLPGTDAVQNTQLILNQLKD